MHDHGGLARPGSPRWAISELSGGRPGDGPGLEHSFPQKRNTPPAASRLDEIRTSSVICRRECLGETPRGAIPLAMCVGNGAVPLFFSSACAGVTIHSVPVGAGDIAGLMGLAHYRSENVFEVS